MRYQRHGCSAARRRVAGVTLVGPTQRQKCTSRSAPAGRYSGLRSGKKMANLHKNARRVSGAAHTQPSSTSHGGFGKISKRIPC